MFDLFNITTKLHQLGIEIQRRTAAVQIKGRRINDVFLHADRKTHTLIDELRMMTLLNASLRTHSLHEENHEISFLTKRKINTYTQIQTLIKIYIQQFVTTFDLFMEKTIVRKTTAATCRYSQNECPKRTSNRDLGFTRRIIPAAAEETVIIADFNQRAESSMRKKTQSNRTMGHKTAQSSS